MGIDTKIILISCIVTEILPKEGFSVMAVLNLPIGRIAQGWQSGIIQILKEHTSEVLETAKQLCLAGIARLSVPATGL